DQRRVTGWLATPHQALTLSLLQVAIEFLQLGILAPLRVIAAARNVDRVKLLLDIPDRDCTHWSFKRSFLERLAVFSQGGFEWAAERQQRLGPAAVFALGEIAGHDHERDEPFAGRVLANVHDFSEAMDFRAFRTVAQEFDQHGNAVAVTDHG